MTTINQIAHKLIVDSLGTHESGPQEIPITMGTIPKQQIVAVIIRDKGYFEFPLVREDSHGFICKMPFHNGRTDTSIISDTATEWFAKKSVMVNSTII